MKKKVIFIIIGVLLGILGVLLWRMFSDEAGTHEEEIEYVIGVSQANMREAWRLALTKEIQEEAGKYANIKVITTDATSSAEKQMQDVDRLLEFGVDLLIISPQDTRSMTQTVSDVYQEIPVIVMDRAVEGFDYTLFIGPDNELIGRQAGQTIADLSQGETGLVLELYGSEKSRQSQERSEGFDSILDNYPEIKKEVVNIETEMRDQAYDMLVTMEEKLNKVDAIFAHNDYLALGAYDALVQLGIEKDIKIVGSDGYSGENEGVDLVKNEKISATISCPTGGREAIQYALNILKKEKGVPKQVILRSKTITKENADEYLASLDKESVDRGQIITLGYSQVGQESEWRIANTRSILEAAKEFQVELALDDGNQSQEKQIAAVRQFIKDKVDVIVISPLVEDGWDEVLREAKAAGIPVVLSDRKIESGEDDLTTTYIGADFIEEGRRAMNWVIKNVPAQTATKNIMEIQGNKGASPTEERKVGFREVLKENTQYQMKYSAHGNFTYEGGKAVIKNYLQKNEWDIDIIYCHNDDMALGAIEALENAGIKAGEDVKIISVDGTKRAFQAMIEGKLNCSVECNPLLGEPLMKAVRDIMAGKEMPFRIITEESVYDQTTAEEEIKKREY